MQFVERKMIRVSATEPEIESEKHRRCTERPFNSVVLAVRNEEANIKRVMQEVYGQNYPGERTEVIVIGGQSEDRTAEIASFFEVAKGALRSVSSSMGPCRLS